MSSRISVLLAGALLCTTATTASAGLVFNIAYSAAVQANADFSAIQTGISFVANEFSGLYSDNVTLNFEIDQATGVLGQSLFSNAYYRGSYANVRAALAADSTSAADAIAVGNMAVSAPIGPGANEWYVTSAQAKAIGLLVGSNSASDGNYTFGSDSGLFDFDRSDGISAGKYDFIGTTEHEFSELMGRVSQLTNQGFGYNLFDTFRYTAAGVRNFSDTACSVYYSIDGGTTNQKDYNCVAGADVQDWASGVPSDPFNAFGSPGVVNALNALDAQVMDVIGWTQNSQQVPEPGSLPLVFVAGGLLWLQSKRKSA